MTSDGKPVSGADNERIPAHQYDGASHQAKIDLASEKRLGQRLRDAFSEIENEPVPERFEKLLRELDRKAKNHGAD